MLEVFGFGCNLSTPSWPGSSRPSTPLNKSKTWMPATSAGMTHQMLERCNSLRRLRLGAWWPLVETAVEHMLGDAVLEHLDRAARDHPATAAPHAIFHQRLARIAERPHRLNGVVGDLEARLVAGCLRDRGLVG